MGAIDQAVIQYPGGALLLVIFVQAGSVWLWKSLKWFVKREFETQEAHQERQDEAIKSIQERLNKYDITFAVSKASFEKFVDKIDIHIEKEDALPLQVAQIATDVAWIKTELTANKTGRL
jgi:hypothetical protein